MDRSLSFNSNIRRLLVSHLLSWEASTMSSFNPAKAKLSLYIYHFTISPSGTPSAKDGFVQTAISSLLWDRAVGSRCWMVPFPSKIYVLSVWYTLLQHPGHVKDSGDLLRLCFSFWYCNCKDGPVLIFRKTLKVWSRKNCTVLERECIDGHASGGNRDPSCVV